MALYTMQNSAEGKDKPVFAHFQQPRKADLRPGHINVDLNAITKNLGIPQFNYDSFKMSYDNDPQIANLVDNFDSDGLVINQEKKDLAVSGNDDNGRDKVSQMAKSATNLSS